MKGNLPKHLSKNPVIKKLMKNFNKTVSGLAKSAKPSKILDVGCGEGFTTIHIAAKLPKSKITALDINDDYIKYAINHNQRPNITYGTGDIFKIKPADYDLVVCNQVLEHVRQYKTAIKKLVSLTNRHLLISVPREPWFRLANILRLKYLSRFGNTPGHVNNWTKNEIKKYMKKFGQVMCITTSFWTIVLVDTRINAS